MLSIIVAVVASLQFSLGVASGMQDNAIMNIRWAMGVHDDMPTTTLPPPFDPSASPVVIPPTSTIDPETVRYYSSLLQYYCYYNSLPAFLLVEGNPCQQFTGPNGVLSNPLARVRSFIHLTFINYCSYLHNHCWLAGEQLSGHSCG